MLWVDCKTNNGFKSLSSKTCRFISFSFPLKMGPLSHSASSTSSRHVHHVDLVCHVDVACDHCVHRLLEIDVLVVVVVVVAVDPVVDVRNSVKDGESHPGKHQGNKLSKFCPCG